MNYQRYFKPGQQLLLRIRNETRSQERTELLTVTVSAAEEETLILALAYGSEAVDQYPFYHELPFEISGEALGLGLKATGSFEKKVDGNQFALKLNPDLQLFQRRISPRFDCELGIRFSRAAKTLQTMRDIWERNLEVLYSPEAPLIFEGFKTTRVNISSGGVRFIIKPPANQGDLCLLLVNLEDRKPPICAIAEIVWTCLQNESAVTAGMRFINILSDDQTRIEQFIQHHS